MMPAGWGSLRRARQFAVDAAARHVADCLAAETDATAAIRRHAEEIDRQRRAVERSGATDGDVEMFGNWLRGAHGRLAALSADHGRATVETARARAALASARTSLEAVETLAREAEVAAIAKTLSDERLDLDDLAARDPSGRAAPP